MSFASGGALLWLIPTGIALLVLYLLKMRRKPLIVPAIFLWPPQTEEIRANALFQKPRLNILFWLQLAALVLIALALAMPQALSRSLTGRVTMIVIDGSASMRATDGSPTRFDEAVKLARQAIDEIKPGDRLGVVLAGQQPQVVFPLTEEPARHGDRLKSIQAEDTSCDMGEALRLAAASLSAYEGARILVLSDGAFRPVQDFQMANGEVTFRVIGKTSKNVGISALGSAITARGREVFCGIRNHGLDAASGELTLEADGKLIDAKNIQIKGGGTWGTTIVVPEETQLCRAILKCDDALKSDNVRVAALADDAHLRVLLVGPGDYFLERALALDPRVTLERASRLPESEKATSSDKGKYDLVVFAGAEEVAVKARGVLTFGQPGPASPAKAAGTVQRPAFLSRAEHAVVKDLEFGSVYVERAQKLSPLGDARSLAEFQQGPFILSREAGGKRQVLVGFDLAQSDWPLHPGFPIFIGQAITYLAGEGRKGLASLPAGKPFTIPLSAGEAFEAPQGLRLTRQEGYAIVRGLPIVGEYKFRVGDDVQRYFANLEDADEPKIEPAAFVQLGGKKVTETAIPQRPTDLWRWVALVGLAVLALEWWVFIRKS